MKRGVNVVVNFDVLEAMVKAGCTASMLIIYLESEAKAAAERKRSGRQRSPFWLHIRQSVLERDVFVCVYCMDDATHVDHVIPLCQGGTNDPSNLVAACERCNLQKGRLTAKQWFARDSFEPPPGWDRHLEQASP